MSETPIFDSLAEISANLWWAWQPDVWQIFREIDPQLWRDTNHNAVSFLKRLDPQEIETRAREHALSSRIQGARRRLREYVDGASPKINMEAGPLYASPVAYFCAEFGIHESLPIYSGGLGVLAGDHMKSSSDLGIPIVGIGLFYVRGYFKQTIDENGWQGEKYDRTPIDEIPIHKALGPDGEPIEIVVDATEGPIKAHIWRIRVGRNWLLLLDADVDGNTDEDRELTHVLYHGDRRTRVRQELLLGVGGIRALRALNIRPGVYHLNEGHSAFAPLEAAYWLMEEQGLTFEDARQRVAHQTVFTTHTPVPAGHDRFDPELLDGTMTPLRERLGLDHYHFHALGRVNPNNPHETFCMTVLALKTSEYRNGVSNLHGHVSRDMWNGLWPHFEQKQVPIGHITNGVHTSTFLAPQMRALYDKHLERGWEARMEQPEAWAPMGEADPGELWETHQILKSQLLDFIGHRVNAQWPEAAAGKVKPGSGLDPDILTIGFARRFATYKRATLLFSDPDRMKALLTNEDRPLQLVFAGKAHPADEGGKRLIQKIIEASEDPEYGGRVVFLPNYDLNIGRHLVQGVDLWFNNPRRPQEACGTSGQKVVLNGALNCSILDGWWAEGYDGHNGFAIGHREEFAVPDAQDSFDSEEIYRVLEQEVLPLYYERDAMGLPMKWIDRVRWAIASLGWRFNANRMVLDYMREAYLPAVGATWK